MQGLLKISRTIDAGTALLGKAVIWLILASILISAGNAISRKLFDVSSNAWLELQWYLFGAAFMLAAAYTLQRNEHIRIDIVSSRLSKNARNVIEIAGHLLMLMPFSLLMLWEMWPSMRDSYDQGETSANFGGLLIWPAKAVIFIGFAVLAIQGISEIIKRIAVMAGAIHDPHETQPASAPVE
jgi:TRAP-type mannitol/chloroaromatic compound transport system permease small subunit